MEVSQEVKRADGDFSFLFLFCGGASGRTSLSYHYRKSIPVKDILHSDCLIDKGDVKVSGLKL